MITEYDAPLTDRDWGRRIAELEADLEDARAQVTNYRQEWDEMLEQLAKRDERIQRLITAGDGLEEYCQHSGNCSGRTGGECLCNCDKRKAAWDAAKEG